MSMTMASATDRISGVVYSSRELLPDAWRETAAAGPVRMFNPGLLALGDSWLLAYRVVAADGLRRIGLTRLDRELRVIPGSQCPLSDGFRLRSNAPYPDVVRHWFADPRLYRFGERLFVYWNSGWHEPRNYQFLHELDPQTLRPIGHARELLLKSGPRQKLEKNWTLFCGDSGVEGYCVYSITPHRVLRFSLAGDGDIEFEDAAQTSWTLDGYPACHGGLRGGAPPQRAGSGYYSFCHSVHDGPTGYRYAAAVYRFAAEAPFAPTHRPLAPLELHNPFGETRVNPRLNPAVAEVIYPCGAAWDGRRWLVSHGINDEHCAISVLGHEAVERALVPVGAAR